MKLIRKNKHNGITRKLFQLMPPDYAQSGTYTMLVTSPTWDTVKAIHFGYGYRGRDTQWFGKTAIRELAKMAIVK